MAGPTRRREVATSPVRQPETLDERYGAGAGRIYLSGLQALVRLPMDARRRDERAGRNTAVFISGYEGSPLAGYDLELARRKALLDSHQVTFSPALNEELAATAVLGELQSALNLIWKAPPRGGLGLWHLIKSRLVSLSVILVIGFLLLVSLVISTALAAFSDYLDWILPGLATILHIVHFTLSFGFTTVLFAMMFKILPDNPVEWEEVWLGGAVAALLFTVGKHLISFYIGSSNMASTYGAAGALIIVLVWVFYSAQIFLLGAEFAKAHSNQRRASMKL